MSKYGAKYRPEYAEQLSSMFANGESVAEVCVSLGISRRAFYDWVNTHPEFAAAYDQGRIECEAWWSKLGRAGAMGKAPVQPALWIINMKNRFGWADKQEITGKDGGPIETKTAVVDEKALSDIADKL